jgi:hypothetical protein
MLSPVEAWATIVPRLPPGTIRMYAVAFDLDTETLQHTHGAPEVPGAYWAKLRKRLGIR